MVFKSLCILVLWTNVALALEGLTLSFLDFPMKMSSGFLTMTLSYLKIFLTFVVLTCDTFENNFPFKCFLKFAFVIRNIVRVFWALQA